MYRHVPMLLVACFALAAAEAQQTIQWRTDVPGAIATAKQTRLPLMFYVLGRNEDRDNNLDNAQKRALADPRVVRLSQNLYQCGFGTSARQSASGFRSGPAIRPMTRRVAGRSARIVRSMCRRLRCRPIPAPMPTRRFIMMPPARPPARSISRAISAPVG